MNTGQLPLELLSPLGDFLERHLGLSFPPCRCRDLAKGLQDAAQEMGFRDILTFTEHLLAAAPSPEVLAVLASQLTIGETYFFREQGMFAVLADHILPPLLAARRANGRRLRLWSAGCASGEEAYSLAISLHQTIPDWQTWQIMLLATDINPRALDKARQGIYSPWSFRGVSANVLETYFQPLAGNRWQVKPWIKEMVTFAPLNLAQDPFPAPLTNTQALDIIFCRNVLMYLTPAVTNRIIGNFAAALQEGGWLLVSPAECSLVQLDCLQARPHATAIPFQKIAPRPAAALPFTRPRPSPAPAARSGQDPPLPVWDLSSAGSRPTQNPDSLDRSEDRPPCTTAVSAAPPTATAASPSEPTAEVEARLAHQRLAAETSGNAAAMATLARMYADLGRLAEANHWGARAIDQDCLNPQHYYLQASILIEQNRLEEATRLLKQALYVQHDFVLAHFSLGRLALQQQRRGEALRHFNNTLFLLQNFSDTESVPAAEGLTIGALRQAVEGIKNQLTSAETAGG